MTKQLLPNHCQRRSRAMAAPDRPGETDTERRFGVRFVGVNRNRTRDTECRAGEDDEAQEIGASSSVPEPAFGATRMRVSRRAFWGIVRC
jgi:hypothetical protein